MTDMGIFHCPRCGMGFRSKHLLSKHVERFCIGRQAAADTFIPKARHRDQQGRKMPRNVETPEHLLAGSGERKRQLSDLQERRAHLGQAQDILSEREKSLLGGYASKDSPSNSQALRKLTEEFHKLRLSLEDAVPTLRPFQPEKDPSRWIAHQQEYRLQLQEMVEAHEHQVADIQARNQQLEQQREEIHRRLSELAIRNSSTSHIEQLLLELKAQEGKNQLALDALRDQVGLIQAADMRHRLAPDNTTNTAGAEEKGGGKVSISFIPFPPAAGPLSSEIRALHMAYLQGGGSDPAVLAQMYNLQVEATALERASERQEHKARKKKPQAAGAGPTGLDAELLAVELENQRLEGELFKLKMQRDRRRADEGSLDKELVELQRAHMMEMAQLHAEIGALRRDAGRLQPRWAGRRSPPMLPPPVAPPLPPPPPLPLPGLQAIHFPGQMGLQTPALSRHVLDPPDTLGPAPYDPAAGFVIFYDFLLGLDPTFIQVCLVAGLYRNGQEMGKPTPLPITYCQMGHAPPYVVDGQRGNYAILSTKQPVPRVQPSTSIALVTVLQASGGFDAYGLEIQHLAPRGWAKVNLFDQLHQLISGRWKIPVRLLPVQSGLTMDQMNRIPQAGKTELYLRVVNARDADVQSMAEINPGNASMYRYPAMVSSHTMPPAGSLPTQRPFHPAPTSLYLSVPPYAGFVDPPPVEEQPVQHKTSQRHGGAALQGGKSNKAPERKVKAQQGEPRKDNAGKRLGFIIDRVKGAPLGDGVLRLTGYHQKTGQVISTRNAGLTWYTTPISSSIKHGYFIFGEQEVTFQELLPQEDMILIVRFYHWPGGAVATAPWDQGLAKQQLSLLETEAWLVAWAILRLTKPAGAGAVRKGDLGAVIWNTGTHQLTLYHGPVPPAHRFSVLPEERQHKRLKPYGHASIRLHVFNDKKPEQPFPPDSPVTLSHPQDWPQPAFIHHTRETPASEPFHATDGFDLYIDGARFLPDAVTISRVTGRIFDSSYNQIGPDISTSIDLNSNIFEPLYNYSVEVRTPAVAPSATLLLKLYAIDRFSFKLSVIGWAALNLFVESGGHRAPAPDAKGIQVSLNDGAHQLRLYHSGPATDQPFSVSALASAGRCVPCATLLVRLLKAPVDSSHRPLQRSLVPQADWLRLGLCQPRPNYSDGVYYSDSAVPTAGESCLHSVMGNRSAVLVREVVPQLAGNEGPALTTDDEISSWIKEKLSRTMDSNPQPFNLTYVSRYLPTYGIKFAVDSAKNLPWSGLTVAHFCFNPPGAFYFGQPWLKYDRPVFVEELDLDSYQQWPMWLDGFKSFPQRHYNEYLAVIIHLYEVVVNPESNSPGEKAATRPMQQGIASLEGKRLLYTLGSEAWAVLQVFSRGYCNTGVYQLPLYRGAPSQPIVTALAQGKCDSVTQGLLDRQVIQLVTGASVVVRIADGRREEELSLHNKQVINQSSLPLESIELYNKEPCGATVADLMLQKAETQHLAQLLILDQL